MLESFYHRVTSPWVYQTTNNKLAIIFRFKAKQVTKAQVLFKDAMDYRTGKESFKKIASYGGIDYFKTEISILTKRFRYVIEIKAMNKKFIFGENGLQTDKAKYFKEGFGFTWSYIHSDNTFKVPEWYSKTNWYQIFPDRFCKSKESSEYDDWNIKNISNEHFLGGDLKGIISKLDYIKSLGFTGIYFTPIFEARTIHRYDTINYLKIDPKLGKEKDFDKLIKVAHQKGLKVMLDGVFNHIGWASKQWQDVIKNKELSKYKDWFFINDFTNLKPAFEYEQNEFSKDYPFETFANVPEMPKLNWANPEVSKFLLKAVTKWTKKGIDGWRLDVSFEPTFNFWRKFKNTAFKINPNIAIIGEVWWDSLIFLHGDQFDSAMNYPFRNNAFNYFINQEISLKQFKNNHIKQQYLYSKPINNGLFNLLGSHDTERIISMAKGKQPIVNAMFTWMLLNPGSPSIYYGDEHNLESANNEDLRRPMDWDFDQDNKTFKLIKWLLNYRNNNIESIKQGIVFLESKKSIKFQLSNNDIFEIDKTNSIFFNNKEIQV